MPIIIASAVAAGALLIGGVVLAVWLMNVYPVIGPLAQGDKQAADEIDPKKADNDNAPEPENLVPLEIKPPILKADREERALPDSVGDVAVGGGGRYLVLHLPKMRKLALFDVSEAKIVHYFPAADDQVYFAAGLRKLLVFLGTANLLQRFDLTSRERELTVASPFQGVIKSVTMGSASNGPAVVFWAVGTGALDDASLGFLDPATLKPLPMRAEGGRGHACYRDHIHYRASADGQVIGGWATSHSPSGVQSFVIRGNRVRAYYEHDSRGHVLPSPDGRMLFTSAGVFTPEIRGLGDNQHGMTLPAVHGDHYLRFQNQERPFGREGGALRFTLHMTGDSRPLVTGPSIDLAMGEEAWTSSQFTFDKRLMFIPDAKVIITIPYTNNRLVLHRFDVDQAIEKSGVDYLFVTSRPASEIVPGKWFSYQMKVKSKQGEAKCRLEAGPQGMKVTPEGKITWKTPATAWPEESVVVTVSDKTGQEIFHTFKLSAAGAPQQVARIEPEPNQFPFDFPKFDPKEFARPPIDRKGDIEPKDKIDFKDNVDPPKADPKIDPKVDPKERDEPRPIEASEWRLPPLPALPTMKRCELTGDKVVRTLPATVEDVTPAGGGRFLILSLPKMRQVAVFDATEGRVVKYLSVGSDNFKIAGSANKLLVALCDTKILQCWDLTTFTRELTISLPVQNDVGGLAIGYASDGPLLIQDGGQRVFLDIRTMKRLSPANDPNPRGFDHVDRARRPILRASGNGQLFVDGGSILNLTPSGYTTQGAADFRDRGGFGTPSFDGKHLFGHGAIYNGAGRKVQGEGINGGESAVYVPAYSGPYYLNIPMGRFHPQIANDTRFRPIAVHCLGDARPLITVKEVNGNFRDTFSGVQDRLAIDQQYHFIPDADLLVNIPMEGDKLELHRLNIQEAMDKSGIDYLFVASTPFSYAVLGKEYTYDVQVNSKKGGVQIAIDSGPKDMKVTGARITWQTPADFADKEVDVIATIKDKSGQEMFHIFKVNVVKVLPAAVQPPAQQPPVPIAKVEEKKEPAPEIKLATPPGNTGLEIKAPNFAGELTTRTLPGAADDVVVGGAGRYLLLRLPGLRQIALFDANEGKLVHYFPVSGDNVRIAAGREKLVMVFPDTKIVQRWDLRTRERELTATINVDSVQNAVLGSASDGPLVLSGGDRFRGGSAAFLDLKNFKDIEVKRTGGGHRGFEGNVRVSADGTVFGIWESGVSPSGLQSLVLVGNELRGFYEHTSVGHIVPGPDGKVLFTAGGLYTYETKSLAESRRTGGFALPAVHGNYYLNIGLGDDFGGRGARADTSVHIVGDSRPLATVPSDLGKVDRFGHGSVPLDKRVVFIPAAKMIVTLPQTNDRLLVRRLDIEEAMEKAGIDYLFVSSQPPHQAFRGRDLVYPIVVKSKKGGVKYTLESGAVGMQLSKTGVLGWKIPADAPSSNEVVIITVRDSAGQEIFHTFKIMVTDPLPGNAAKPPELEVKKEPDQVAPPRKVDDPPPLKIDPEPKKAAEQPKKVDPGKTEPEPNDPSQSPTKRSDPSELKIQPRPATTAQDLSATLPPMLDEVKTKLIQPAQFALELPFKGASVRGLYFAHNVKDRVYICCRTTGFQDLLYYVVDWQKKQLVASATVPVGGLLTGRSDVSPEGNFIAVECRNSKLSIWSIPDNRIVVDNWQMPDPGWKDFSGLCGFYFLDEKRLLTNTGKGGVHAWQFPEMKLLWHLPPQPKRVMGTPLSEREGVAINADRTRLALYSGVSFYIIDTATGKIIFETSSFAEKQRVFQVRGVAFSPDNRTLAATMPDPNGVEGSRDPCLVTFDLQNGAMTRVTKSAPLGNLVFTRPTWLNEELVWVGSLQVTNLMDPSTARPVLRAIHDGAVPPAAHENRLWWISTIGQNQQVCWLAASTPPTITPTLADCRLTPWGWTKQ